MSEMRTTKSLEADLDEKISSKHVIALLPSGEIYHRVSDDEWEPYPFDEGMTPIEVMRDQMAGRTPGR
jgi:hypothetical protein